MTPRGKSWHVPFIFKYNAPSPKDALHVVFLQRLSEDERGQVLQNLNETDDEWVSRLNVQAPSPRRLVAKAWIRDYWPSSDVILDIAKAAYFGTDDLGGAREEEKYQSLILCDSGWEAGNVIAARWETDQTAGESRLIAARVPMNVANVLLTACDSIEGCTLVTVLGEEAFEESKVDFYKDGSQQVTEDAEKTSTPYEWPSSLPKDIALSEKDPCIISLRKLEETAVDKLLSTIITGDEDKQKFSNIKIHNWQDRQPSRADIYHIFQAMHNNTPEANRNMNAFFIDYILQGDNSEPQILVATTFRVDRPSECVQVIPIQTGDFLKFWRMAANGLGESELEELGELTRKENIYDLSPHFKFGVFGTYPFKSFYTDKTDDVEGAPVFFLQPFIPEEERTARTALSGVTDIEDDKDYAFLGYLWQNDEAKHSLEDLRDLFESCEPFSPAYNAKSPGPYSFVNYPHHFIALDERVLDPENPKVWLVSSLDFHGEDVSDELGWVYGTNDASEAHINWINLDIANVGPEECFDDGETTKLWLSDLKEYAAHDWNSEDEN